MIFCASEFTVHLNEYHIFFLNYLKRMIEQLVSCAGYICGKMKEKKVTKPDSNRSPAEPKSGNYSLNAKIQFYLIEAS
jgi:hypothetical protein